MKLFQKFFKNGEKLNASEIALCCENNKYKTLDSYLSDISQKLAGTVLFEGKEYGTVTLSESAANFKKIKIITAQSGGVYLPIIEIENPNNKIFKTMMFHATYGTKWYAKDYKISGTQITRVASVCTYINSSGAQGYVREDEQDSWNITIDKVIGYR